MANQGWIGGQTYVEKLTMMAGGVVLSREHYGVGRDICSERV